jgi:cation diffusion facilitator CzcD-associated flavoprotein CzcO
MKNVLRKGLEKQLPADFDIDTHFTPPYNPWDQRLCLVPDADLFQALGKHTVDIVTDHIETFDETGIQLTSGKHLDADIIITATGLNVLVLGGVQYVVDGHEIDLTQCVGYRGMMLSGIPNMAWAIGYTNASWTLKADLVCQYVTRLLRYMDEHGYRKVMPRWTEPELPTNPFIDLTSGYILRAVDKFPKQASRDPWRLYQNYIKDLRLIRRARLDDGALEFTTPARPAVRTPEAA